MGTFLNKSMRDLSVSHGLSYISFLQISCVFLSLKPNNNNFHNLNREQNTEISDMFSLSLHQCHLTAAEVPVVLIILLVSMLLKEVNNIENSTHKFQLFNIKNTIWGWHVTAV